MATGQSPLGLLQRALPGAAVGGHPEPAIGLERSSSFGGTTQSKPH